MTEPTFLYVEDDPYSREALETIFTRVLNIKRFYLFADSDNFIARLKALPTRPDFILLDIHLTPHDGFEILGMLRADPEVADIQVIALTASVMSEEVAQLRKSGFDGGIGKPIDVLTFPDVIERIMQGETVWSMAGE